MVPPEDEVTAEPVEPPVEDTAVSSLPPEAVEDTGAGGLPGWVLPLVGVLILAAGGTALFFQLRTGKNGDYSI